MERQGHLALPFLFISFGNHQPRNYLTTEELVEAINPLDHQQRPFLALLLD
jgi:hypothetical protein